MVKNQNIIVQKAVDIFMRQEGERLFVTHTADELLFTGYDDKLLQFVKNISIPGLNFPFTKFGWFADVSNKYNNKRKFKKKTPNLT